MTSESQTRPRILKGALVAYESQLLGAVPNVVVFQYNAEQLSRTLADRAPRPETGNVGAAREDAKRVLGPPVETISISVELDAADQLADPAKHPQIVAHGLNPALAALELLLYPPTRQVLLNRTLSQSGKVQVCPPEIPLVLFVWGPSRVLPVRLTNVSITETAFDPALNPLQAKVDLSMQVLSYMDLKENSIGYGAYLATQTQKEGLAALNVVTKVERAIGITPF